MPAKFAVRTDFPISLNYMKNQWDILVTLALASGSKWPGLTSVIDVSDTSSLFLYGYENHIDDFLKQNNNYRFRAESGLKVLGLRNGRPWMIQLADASVATSTVPKNGCVYNTGRREKACGQVRYILMKDIFSKVRVSHKEKDLAKSNLGYNKKLIW